MKTSSVLTPLILLFTIQFSGMSQPQVVADTLITEIVSSLRKNYLIRDQAELESCPLYSEDGKYIPYPDIDFDKFQLVGYVYEGSNCDRSMAKSRLRKTNRAFTIQFVINTRNGCRDIASRMVWFIIEKPPNGESVYFERTDLNTFLATQ